jgi:hypothetical protein
VQRAARVAVTMAVERVPTTSFLFSIPKLHLASFDLLGEPAR